MWKREEEDRKPRGTQHLYFLIIIFLVFTKRTGQFSRGRCFWLKQWWRSSGCISIAQWSHPIMCKRCIGVDKRTKDRKRSREKLMYEDSCGGGAMGPGVTQLSISVLPGIKCASHDITEFVGMTLDCVSFLSTVHGKTAAFVKKSLASF